MTVIGWSALFNRRDGNEFFPSLVPDQPIRDALASGATENPKVGMKMVKAVYSLLTRLEQLGVGDDSWVAIIASSSSDERYMLGRAGDVWYTRQGYLFATAGALDALLTPSPLVTNQAVLFTRRWLDLIVALFEATGKEPPFTPSEVTRVAQLEQYARRQPVSDAMMAATDALYVYMRDLDLKDGITRPRDYPQDGTGIATVPGVAQRQLIYVQPEPAGQVAVAGVEWEERGPRMEEVAEARLEGDGIGEEDGRQDRMELGFVKRVRPGFS